MIFRPFLLSSIVLMANGQRPMAIITFINPHAILFFMAQWHRGTVGRKPTGGLYKQARKKRIYEKGSIAANTTIGKLKSKIIRTKGGGQKVRVMQSDCVNLFDGKVYMKAKIESVIENKANRNYARRNVITKGAILKTDKGKAVVTSRASQDGTINAVLIKE